MVTMGNVWDRTTEFVGDRTAAILPLALVGVVLPAVVSAVIATLGQVPGAISPAWGLVNLLASLLQIWGILALTALVIAHEHGSAGAGRVATRRFLPALGLYALIGVAILVLMIPLVVLVGLSGIDMSQMAAGTMQLSRRVPQAYALPIGIYILVVVIAAIVIFTRLAVVNGVIVAERRGVGAFGRAWGMTRGLTWRLIGVLILYAIVLGITTSAVQFVFGSVFSLILGGGPASTAAVLTALLAALVGSVFTVLVTVFCAQLYLALDTRREAAIFS